MRYCIGTDRRIVGVTQGRRCPHPRKCQMCISDTELLKLIKREETDERIRDIEGRRVCLDLDVSVVMTDRCDANTVHTFIYIYTY